VLSALLSNLVLVVSQRPNFQENHGRKCEQILNHHSFGSGRGRMHCSRQNIIAGKHYHMNYRDTLLQSSQRPSTPPPTARSGTSALLARAGFLHLISNFTSTPLFLSSTLALRRRQGETLLSTKLLAPGKPGLFTVGPIFCSAMRAKLMSCISCSDSPHDDAGRL
jgi:hypothetical protein